MTISNSHHSLLGVGSTLPVILGAVRAELVGNIIPFRSDLGHFGSESPPL